MKSGADDAIGSSVAQDNTLASLGNLSEWEEKDNESEEDGRENSEGDELAVCVHFFLFLALNRETQDAPNIVRSIKKNANSIRRPIT